MNAAQPTEQRLDRTDEEREYYSLNAKVYPIFAPFYDLVVFPIRRLRLEVAVLAALDARSRVLDVATGTGAQARAFAEKAGELVGVDLSEPMLRIARREHRLANLTFRRADATQLPFRDASLDIACISLHSTRCRGPFADGRSRRWPALPCPAARSSSSTTHRLAAWSRTRSRAS